MNSSTGLLTATLGGPAGLRSRVFGVPEPVNFPPTLKLISDSISQDDGTLVALEPDTSGNGYDATQSVSKPTFKTAIINGHPVVRYADPSWLTCGNVAALNFDRTDPFMVIWVGSVVDASASNFVVAKQLNSGANNGWYCLMGGPINNVRFIMQNGSQAAFISGTTTLANNTPYVIAFINSGAGDASGMSIYINGVLETTTVTQNDLSSSLLPNTASVTIGSRDAGGVPLNGDNATALVFNSASSPARAAWNSYLLSKYAISPSAPLKLVIADGNSLTAGQDSTAGNDYPSVLSRLLGLHWAKFNFGVGGQTTEQINADAAAQVDPRYNAANAKNIVVFWEGRNSMVPTGGNESAAVSYAASTTYVQGRQAAGFKVILCTVIDDQGADSTGFTAKQNAYNALAVANTAGADLVVQLHLDARLSDASNATYFNADKIHLTDAGYAVVAQLVYAGVLTL